MAQAYFSLVTTTGKIKMAQSAAGGDAVTITHFAIGDGNGAETNPSAASTALVREVWRTQVESVITDPDNPSAILVTAIIPTNAGGWWMREFGIFDQAGSMIAVAKPVSQYKPTALEGQLEDIRYEFQIIIGENANVTLLVDPSLLFATRAWVENRRIPMGQLMRLPWLPVLSMTLSSAPGNPAVGDSYLVPSNATGIWLANIGKIAEWNGTSWNYVLPPDGHGISLPDGRIFERIGGAYVEKLALDVQSGKWSYAISGGTANALTATLSPAPAALAAGMHITVLVSTANTAAATLNVNGLGAVPIVTATGATLSAGDLPAGMPVDLVYSGTSWVLSPTVMMRGKMDVFSATGTFTWVCPAGVYRVKATVTGAGGGGSRASANQPGSSGGAGGTAIGYVSVVPGTSYTIIVGTGGVAGNYGSGGTVEGKPGSSSAALGLTGNAGSGATLLTNGAGGNASGGALNLRGGDGQDAVSNSTGFSANGGSSFWGGGLSSGTSDGAKGVTPGTGGCSAYGGFDIAGGAGADGIVVLEY